MSALFSRGRHSFYYTGHQAVCSFLLRETLSLSSLAVHYTKILEKDGTEQKKVSASLAKYAETWENHLLSQEVAVSLNEVGSCVSNMEQDLLHSKI